MHLQCELTPRERLIWLFGNDEPFNIHWRASITGKVTLEQIEKALDALQQSHPLLQSTISQDEPLRFLKTQLPITLHHHHQRTSSTSWQAIALKQLSKATTVKDGETPLYLDWVDGETEHELIFTFDHAFCDGRCLSVLLGDFLNYLSEIIGGGEAAIKSYPLRPKLEEMIPKIEEPLDDSVKSIPPDTQGLTLEKPPYQYALPYHKVLSEQQTTEIIAKAKAQQVSVHGLLCAAMSVNYLDFAKQHNLKGPFDCFTPADFRKSLPQEIDDGELGNFATGIVIRFDEELSDLIAFSQTVTSDIKKYFASDDAIRAMNDFASYHRVGITGPEIVELLKLRTLLAAVSNIGIVNIPTKLNGFEVTDISTAVASPLASGNKNVLWLIAQTWNGHLVFDLFYHTPYITEAYAEKFLGCVVETLMGI